MRLHVLQGHTFGRCDSANRSDLIEDQILRLGRCQAKIATAEPDKVGKARVSTDRDATLLRTPDC
jgi:ATP-dependent 26S proteasome regulatory subunit